MAIGLSIASLDPIHEENASILQIESETLTTHENGTLIVNSGI